MNNLAHLIDAHIILDPKTRDKMIGNLYGILQGIEHCELSKEMKSDVESVISELRSLREVER